MHVAELPALSVAVHVTVVSPLPNESPDIRSHWNCGDVSIMSVTIGLGQVTGLEAAFTFGGHVISGATLSVRRMIIDSFYT